MTSEGDANHGAARARVGAGGWMDRFFTHVAGTVLFAMMALTFVDVIGRYLFNAPVKGAYELTEFAMGVIAFIGFPLVCWHDQHVRVTLLDEPIGRALGGRGRLALEAALLAAAALMCGFLAVRLWAMASLLAAGGDRSQHLGIPLAPLAYFMFAGALAASIACAARALLRAIGRLPPRADGMS